MQQALNQYLVVDCDGEGLSDFNYSLEPEREEGGGSCGRRQVVNDVS